MNHDDTSRHITNHDNTSRNITIDQIEDGGHGHRYENLVKRNYVKEPLLASEAILEVVI